MKTRRQTTPLNLSNARWLAYALRDGASPLAAALSAEAEIHYSGEIIARFGCNRLGRFDLQGGAKLVFPNADSLAWGDPEDTIFTGEKSSSGEMVDTVLLHRSLDLLTAGGTGLKVSRRERGRSAKSQP